MNVAVTDFAADIVTEQVDVPEHAPLHPAKVDPVPAVAVSVTEVPDEYVFVQLVEQLDCVPEGEKATLPEPEPDFVYEMS